MRNSFPTARAGAVLVAALVMSSAACDLGLPAGRAPHREGNRLDMIDQPKLKPQRQDGFTYRASGIFEPVPGTVAVDETPYPYAQADAAKAGAELINPLPHSPEVVAHGKFVYENVCITCHGPTGAGDGYVAAVFTKPPSLMTQRVRDWPDGEIFHRPMRGQNSMPSHARQIDTRDAWSVVHYIRDLQSREPVAPAAAPAVAPAGAPSAPLAGAMAGQAPSSSPTPASAPSRRGQP